MSDQQDDLAPDADEPGDDLPEELAEHVHEGDIIADDVDHPDPLLPENPQEAA